MSGCKAVVHITKQDLQLSTLLFAAMRFKILWTETKQTLEVENLCHRFHNLENLWLKCCELFSSSMKQSIQYQACDGYITQQLQLITDNALAHMVCKALK